MVKLLAALPDKHVRALAKKGDKAAQDEMVKRGLASDPRLLSAARRYRHQFRPRDKWDWV